MSGSWKTRPRRRWARCSARDSSPRCQGGNDVELRAKWNFEEGTVTKADLKKKMDELDDLDGVRDGWFDLDVLRRFGESDDATR